MGGNEQKFVQEAFDTNWIAPLGPHVNGFETDLKTFLKNPDKEVAVLSSGTAAIHLALVMLNVGYQDLVVCQSMTFSASANPIVYLGAKPVFVDSESLTGNICPVALRAAIEDCINKGKKPKAIIAVHLYGMPYQVDEMNAIAKEFNIPILEDSAESLGSTYKGENCGTFGDFGVLSFNGNKIITTSGGGALVTPNMELKNKTVFLSTQARDNAPHYQHSAIGYNYRMSNVCAGIGRGQMQVLQAHVDLRRAMNKFYVDLFQEIDYITVLVEPNHDYYSNFWLSSIVVQENNQGKNREDLRLHLEKYNIESRPLWKPMHLQPIFENAPYYGGKIAENLFENGLCLPSGSNLTNEDRHRIKTAIQEYLNL
jgi:dTDP-4-amino-4,6-dideoxygalactose transaminase